MLHCTQLDSTCHTFYLLDSANETVCGAVPKVCAELGWLQADDTDEWDVFWSDQSISLARAVAMQPMQVLI